MKHNTTFWIITLLTMAVPVLKAQPCAPPSNVTATPGMVCPGGTALLNATSAGNSINWYDVPSGGTALGFSASGANFSVTPSINTTYYAEAIGAQTGSQTFPSPAATTARATPLYGARAPRPKTSPTQWPAQTPFR